MGILDRIKNFFKIEEPEQIQPISNKIQFEYLDSNLEKELLEIEKKLYNVKKSIRGEIEKFFSALNEKLLVLKSVSLENRKETEKLKLIVNENLKIYIANVEKLIESLNKNKENIDRIKETIFNFEKSSKNSFEKASILIGKELEETRDKIKDMIFSLNRILNDNKELFEKKKKIEELQSLFGKIKEFEIQEKECKKEILNKEEMKKQLEIEKKDKELNIEKIKNSGEFKNYEQEKEKQKKEKKEYENQALRLKEKINFKELKRNHHTNSKNMEIIKSYDDNFLLALEEDEDLKIIELINNEALSAAIKGTREKLLAFKQMQEHTVEKKLKLLESEMNLIVEKIANVRINVDNSIGRLNKIENKKNEMKKEIREKLEALGFSLV